MLHQTSPTKIAISQTLSRMIMAIAVNKVMSIRRTRYFRPHHHTHTHSRLLWGMHQVIPPVESSHRSASGSSRTSMYGVLCRTSNRQPPFLVILPHSSTANEERKKKGAGAVASAGSTRQHSTEMIDICRLRDTLCLLKDGLANRPLEADCCHSELPPQALPPSPACVASAAMAKERL